MTNSKAKLADVVESNIVEATAIAIRNDVAGVSQDVMQDEIKASHLQNIGSMAIENAIEEDKAAYELQLDEIQECVDKAKKRLKERQTKFDKAVNRFQTQLVATELRKKRAAVIKTLSSLNDLAKPLNINSEDGDDDINTFHSQDSDGDTLEARAGVVGWNFEIKQGTGYSSSGLDFKGERPLSKKLVGLYKDIEDAKEDIDTLMNANKGVRVQIQKLERERRDLQRKLRSQVISKSIVAKEIDQMLKGSRSKVKALALPANLKK